jgi:monofunctional biosynthetic peptidoglycan transglycosylase
MRTSLRHLGRFAALLLLCALALQLYFLLRIALMAVLAPASTTFQRSEAWRLLSEHDSPAWRQQWVSGSQIADTLKRAVITSEDAGFVEHSGIEWEAIEKAWERNQQAARRAQGRTSAPASNAATARTSRVVGGSTISQQLAKNLFLSGERSLPRKGQELVITYMLETLLTKQRILEIYLNHVEWGEGLFGAQAAAQHYFQVDAGRLSSLQAARLAVMLPAPKRFEKRPNSAYVAGRAQTIATRMGSVVLP